MIPLTRQGMAPHLPKDEADRLKFPSLEQLRDFNDRSAFGLVPIGIPGIEKRLARYAVFYSRMGFVYRFSPLSADELRFIPEREWQEWALTIDLSEFDDEEAMTAIIRITGGNFSGCSHRWRR
jgi:DNA transposition AAA+ family ATPase